MECPHCKKEIRVDFFDDTPGAVFICRESANDFVVVWPAIWGIKKYEGGEKFGRGIDNLPMAAVIEGLSLVLEDDECNEVFFDCPVDVEAWLVKPIKEGYQWEQVDDQIGFSART